MSLVSYSLLLYGPGLQNVQNFDFSKNDNLHIILYIFIYIYIYIHILYIDVCDRAGL